MLFGQPNLLPELEPHHVEDRSLRKRAGYLKRCKEAVWKRCTQARGVRHTPKHSEERHPKIGELLLIKLEDKNRGKWKFGVVTDHIKGRDGVVRAAKLRVGTSCIERAVQQLFPLELCCDRVRDEADKPTPLRVEAPEFSRHELLSL